MANKDNQSKQHRIYVKESKSWVVSKRMAVVSALQANATYVTWIV